VQRCRGVAAWWRWMEVQMQRCRGGAEVMQTRCREVQVQRFRWRVKSCRDAEVKRCRGGAEV
jgi:hypothetical protein